VGLGDRLRKLRKQLQVKARAVGGKARVGAELLRLDRGTLRAWSEQITAVEAALGQPTARAYTDLVLTGARRQRRLGRQLALDVPDNLARVAEGERAEYLRLMDMVVRQRPEAVGMVARTLPRLMERLEGPALANFVGSGLDMHDLDAGRAEVFLKAESASGQKELERLSLGLPLSDVSRTLALYARAHCGEDVQIRPVPARQGRRAFSEGRHLYLPERVDRYGDERDFTVYRVLAARTAAYIEFGSFELDLRKVPGDWAHPAHDESELERFFRSFPNKSLAKDLFAVVEDARVEGAMLEEYPGLARDIVTLRPDELALRPDFEDLAPVEAMVEGLLQRSWGVRSPGGGELGEQVEQLWTRILPALDPMASVADSAALVPQLYQVADALLRKVADEPPPDPKEQGGGKGKKPPTPDGSSKPEDGAGGAEQDYKGLEANGLGSAMRPEEMSPDDRAADEQARDVQDAMAEEGLEATLREIRRAMRQDRGGDESSYDEMVAFLERNPPAEGGQVEIGPDREAIEHQARQSGRPLDPDADPNAKGVIQPEWDHGIQDYKPAWVQVKEHKLEPDSGEFVQGVLDEYGAEIRQLRRRFQALRPEQMRRVRGVVDGDEFDLDRLIEARVERRAGGTPSDRIYSRHHRNQRDVAVAFLVDLSSSTNEVAGETGKRIIHVEKEALVMIAEAVDAIGDACGIYGFSGYGRDHVAFYVAKDFKDPYDDTVRRRIGRMTHKMENRDGAAIRYAARKLLAQPASTRLLVLLSDGRPLDCGCDAYYDAYAQADTKVALRELRQQGIHPFCITVDPRARAYLKEMYGDVGFVVIDRAETLPQRLPAIYQRLTR
jgi:nitric oxide reductase NorD protein